MYLYIYSISYFGNIIFLNICLLKYKNFFNKTQPILILDFVHN